MPSVRVRKVYSSIEEPEIPNDTRPTASNGNTATSRGSPRRPRRRTLTSIFSSSHSPASEHEDQVPSTSSPNVLVPPTVVTPDELDEEGHQADNEDDTRNTQKPRGMIAESMARRARQRRSSLAATRAFSLDPNRLGMESAANRRGRGFSVSESATDAAPSRPVADSSLLVVPGSPQSGEGSDGPRMRRNSSLVSARGGEGTSVGIILPDGNLRGRAASAMGVSVDGNMSQNRAVDVEADGMDLDEDEDEHMSSDYTTDGSDIDEEEHHLDEVVDHLDVIDPQVAMVSHLSNAANSILIPRLPMYSRRPVVTLPTLTPSATLDSLIEKGEGGGEKKQKKRFPRRPHRKDQDELDAHVEHVLKRRAKIRRALRGLWQFLKTPTGIVVGIYGFAVVFWGAAIVLFLVKWINLHNENQQKFWIEVSSQVVNALFTVTGVGLIPWRVMDTVRILKIWHYKRLDRKLRKKQGLPPLEDEDELPDPLLDPNFTHVLTEKQQKDLRLQQRRFTKSQTWYRAHATDTHRAFPISTALTICLLVDANSVFQCLLCGTMWGLNRYTRPPWTTGLLIPAAFICAIAAGVIIARGGSKTKKKAEVEQRLRQALAEGRSSQAHEANGVYARRAGLVGIIPMPPDDDDDEDRDQQDHPNGLSTRGD